VIFVESHCVNELSVDCRRCITAVMRHSLHRAAERCSVGPDKHEKTMPMNDDDDDGCLRSYRAKSKSSVELRGP